MRYSNFLLLLLLLTASAGVYYLVDALVTDEMFISNAPENFNQDLIEELVKKRYDFKWQAWFYFFRAVWLLIKVTVTILVIRIGFYFFNIDISPVSILQIVVMAWFVYLIPSILRVCWFNFVETSYSMSDIFKLSMYYPTDSLLNQLGDPYAKVLRPFRVFSPVEVIFCFTICYLLKVNGVNFQKTIRPVFASNFIFLFVLAVFMAFLTSLRL